MSYVPRMAEEIPRYPGIQMPRYPGWKRRQPDTKIFSKEDSQVSICPDTQDGREDNQIPRYLAEKIPRYPCAKKPRMAEGLREAFKNILASDPVILIK